MSSAVFTGHCYSVLVAVYLWQSPLVWSLHVSGSFHRSLHYQSLEVTECLLGLLHYLPAVSFWWTLDVFDRVHRSLSVSVSQYWSQAVTADL